MYELSGGCGGGKASLSHIMKVLGRVTSSTAKSTPVMNGSYEQGTKFSNIPLAFSGGRPLYNKSLAVLSTNNCFCFQPFV